MGSGYLDRVVLEGDARVFGEGGCGNTCTSDLVYNHLKPNFLCLIIYKNRVF